MKIRMNTWLLRLMLPVIAVFMASLAPAQDSPSTEDSEETFWRLVAMEGRPSGMAEGLADELRTQGYQNVVVEENPDGTMNVYVGRFASSAMAQAVARELQDEGFLINPTPRPFTDSTAGPAVPLPSQPTFDPTPTATPAPTPTPLPEITLAEQLRQLSTEAREAEEAGEKALALDLWERIIAIADPGSAVRQAAQENRARLNRELGEMAANQPGGGFTVPVDEDGMSPVVIAIGVLVAVILIGGGIFLFFKKTKKREEELLAEVRKASSGSSASSAKVPASASAGAPPKLSAPPPASPPAGPQEVGPEARIRPGTVSRAEQERQAQAEQQKQQQAPAQPESPAPSAPPPAAQQPPPQEQPARPAAPPAGAGGTSDSGVKIDFLFDDEDDSPAEEAPQKKREDSTQFSVPPAPDSTPEAPQPAAEGTPSPQPAAAPAGAGEAGVFYAQDFESEEEGRMPANWKGEYDYASLTVGSEGASGGKRCLRFEKKQGIGSAYYSCRFPNAGGRFAVEFDLRCDDKNKYLLGFYIEKDGDFRQSIATIVHRKNSTAKPSLRIQNESTPYEFGEWAHIKFEIDLPRHILDGYVNDKAIIMGARLTNSPKAVNTLSIRDNLATTGVLLIDNIKIYRV